RALWEEKGPRDYQMKYTKNGTVTGTFEVEVLNRKVQKVTDDGRLLERRQFPYHSMSALFDDLEVFSKMRSQPGGGRRFLVAQFDKEDGHLRHYIFSDPSTGQRIEVTVETLKSIIDSNSNSSSR